MSVSWEEFGAGTIGGFVGKLVEFPMDTVKVLLQTQHDLTTRDCIRKLYHTEGLSGFYRGVTIPLLGSMAEISCLMTSYGFAKRYLGERPGTELPMWKLALAGGFAGIGVSAVLTPVELIKCRMQVQHSAAYRGPKYRGPLDCIVQTVKSDGPQGLFRGMFGTLCREIPGNVAWFGVYELMASRFRDVDGHVAPIGSIIAGASAGVAYWTVPFPADTVKTRIQISSQAGYNQHTAFFQVFKHILATEGVRGLYRGWAVTALRAAPSNAAVFFAYELCMKAFTGHISLDGHPQHDGHNPALQAVELQVSPEVLAAEIEARGLMPMVLKLASTEQLEQALRGRQMELTANSLEAVCC